MEWRDLAFLHWRVDAALLQRLLPAGLSCDTFDGCGWVGVVPFRMAATRVRWLPPVPTTAGFLELNVRTYVRAGERPGVWFFSLDAASRLAVGGARAGFGLPYFHARMHLARSGAAVHYESERADRRAPPARFAARWSPTGAFAAAAPGSLEHFLCERYCLYARRRGRLVCGEVAHSPWQLAPAEVELACCDMTRLLGTGLGASPASVLAARDLAVVAWSPRVIAEVTP